jgi:hypothetical protein
METAMPGSSSWMPCAAQGVEGFDDDDDDDDTVPGKTTEKMKKTAKT